MTKRRLFLATVAAFVVVACFGSERTGTSDEELTTGVALATYSNMPGVNASGDENHYATTSTLTVADTNCGATGNAFRTTTAWEEESWGGSNHPVALWLGNECGFNPPTINFGGAARQITNALMGGNATEWTTQFGGPTMFWVKEPTLVPIVDPAGNQSPPNARAIALVGLVGPSATSSTATAVAISMSEDGGQTWKHPHLINNLPQNGIDDLAVTAGTHVDKTAGGYVGKLQTNTFDVYITWSDPSGHRWFDAFSYQLSNIGGTWAPHWLAAPIDLSANTVINPGGVPRVIQDMSIVSGTVAQAPNQSFVVVQWPATGDFGNNCPNNNYFLNQVWKGAASYDYGTTWHAMPDSHPVSLSWPLCVSWGFENSARSTLAFEPNTHTVIDAVAMPDLGGTAGTYIIANAFAMLGVLPPLTLTQVFHSTHTKSPEDQFLPVVGAARGASGPQGDVTIAWVDTFEDPLNEDAPSGLYAVTTQTFSVAAPGFSPVARVWTIPPAPPVDMFSLVAHAPGLDALGRHNSISVQGFSWATFAGDVTHLSGGTPYTSMDTVSISPL